MPYTTLEQLKNAWIFKHKSLPLDEQLLAQIKPLSATRAKQVWDTFVSKQVDHPDFFKQGDWAHNPNTWLDKGNWENTWDSDEPELPELIAEHLTWDVNTVVYYCTSRDRVIETTWQVFLQAWKNFLFMDDGTLLIGKKREQVVQFFSDGSFQIGKK